jgi:hypothetical protein
VYDNAILDLLVDNVPWREFSDQIGEDMTGKDGPPPGVGNSFPLWKERGSQGNTVQRGVKEIRTEGVRIQ